MGKLVFRVASDWQEVVRLRTEIEKLKQTLLSMDSTQSPDTFKKLNVQLGESTKKMNILISDAAKAGATMENDFKKGIYDGEKAVNSLSEEIIKQKNIIRETQNDVSMLTEQYKKLGKYDPKRQSLSDELNRAKAALREQKYALGELQSQQALARLSTKALKDEYALFKDESKAVITTNDGVGVSFKKMLATIGGIAMLKQVASNVVSTAGMFQKYESVLTNALDGSSDKAKAYLSDINSFAAKTNFQLDELTDDFIKFVNRGVTPSMDAMKRMGDFTNTVAKPFDQLTEAILDINNPERWKEFGVRVQTEGNKVKLSFRDMTVECDRTVESVMKAVEQFGSMKGVEGSTEAISKTIEGQMSNLEDTITTALAEIGLANQGLISGSISAVDTIVKNYDIIGKSVLSLIEIYGVYRAGLLINTIVEQGSVKSIWAKITATKAATIAQAAYNKVLAMNPYVAVGMAVVSLGVAVYTLAEHTTYAEKTARSAAESMEKMKNASENLKNKINELLSVIRDETSTQYKKADAYLNLQNILPEVFKNMDIEKIKLMDKLSLLEKINKASDMREIVGAKTNVVLAQKEVDKINALIAADSQRGTYSGQYEIQLSDAKSKLEAAKKVVADIEKIQIEANKQKEKDDKKSVVKNKEHWTNQKKEAETALNSIASSQKKLMDAGNFKGIDAAVVKSYKDNIKKLKEAEKELKVYDSSTKQENKARKESDKQLKQQEKLAEDLLSLRRKNQQDEINLMADGTDKKLAQIDLDYRKELDAIRKQEQEWSKTNGGKLTEEQSVQISLSYSQAESKRGKSISEVNKEALEAMNRYLKEYGTFQQKKEAITKEYNEKIAKATTEGDKKILQKEMEEALSSVDMDKLKQEINWELIFSDLSKVSKKSLEQVKQQLKAFKNSDEYKNMAVDQKKVIDEALNNIQSTIIDKGGLLGDLPEQLDALRIAQEELKQAQDEYNKALKTGTDAEKEAALKKKNNAEKNVQNAETNVTKSADKTKQNLITLADTITQLGSSSEMSLSQIGNLASGLVDVFSEAGSKLGGIIGAAFSLLDGIEKQGLDGFVENVFSSVFRAGASMWDTITFGAFSKITGSGESDKNLEKDLEYLAQSNQDLKNSLDNLSEKMDKASVADASDIYAVQKKNIETLEANTREAMQRSAAAYNNGFLGIGGSHSSGSKIDKGMSTSEWKRVSDIVGQSISSAGQFFRLSSEQMAKLAEEDTSLYSKIKDLANNGYKDAAQYMDEYITYYKQLEELENAYNEKLTNTSFDSIRNDFKNALLDMESDAEDFADNFEKMMQNAIVESLMTKKYDKLLQEWYSDFAKAMEGDGKISENEQVSLKRQWENITKQAIAERDALKEVMGWESESESTRTASQKGIATASQDSVDENNGRLAVMQGHTYSINENVTRMATGIDTIANHTANLSCLTNIDKTMQSILSMRDAALTHLSNIDGHTSRLEAIEDAIVFMKNDINTMLIKGLKLSKN